MQKAEPVNPVRLRFFKSYHIVENMAAAYLRTRLHRALGLILQSFDALATVPQDSAIPYKPNSEVGVRKFASFAALSVLSFLLLIPAVCAGQSDATLLASDNGAAASTNTTSGNAADKAQPANDTAGEGGGAVVEQSPAPAQNGRILGSKVGVGVKASLLGIGFEAATPITYHTNVRAGFNMFSYSRGFTNDGVNYAASLSFRSFESHFDWFPFSGGFHLSPGVMLYNGNQIKANATVTGGQTFTLGGTGYMSYSANPITGTGKIGFNTVAPMVTLGWGNLVPRKNKHISVPFEVGMLFQGSPKATLNLAGTACDTTGANCQNVAGDASFQNNVVAQQNKLNNDMSFFKVYPVISLGFGYKF